MAEARLTAITNAPNSGGTVVLAEARTPFELEAIRRWARVHRPGARVVRREDVDFADLSSDTLLTPARVAWLPPHRRGGRRVTLADVMMLRNPWRPPAPLQARIATRSPDRAQVVAGEPATVAELRAAYEARVAEGEPFEDFVLVQAALAAERAERQVIGDR